MAERAQDRINLQLGNYRLQRLLGHGGFADVFLGQHVFLNTEAAIKVLHTQLLDKDLDKFLQEARIIARLTHPNIIHVLDFGTYEEEPFLVMEYAPHGNLRDHHPRGTIVDLQTTVSYVKQIAAGLQYAHNASLVHCDVKPENMLVGQNKQILLSDFGISIVTQGTQSQSTLQEIQGTAAYMAPEQINGKPKPASDQYALGIVTYEWLCGEKPFTGTFLELCNKHMTQTPPSLHSKNPAITPEIEYVVMTALEKDPAKRFSSVRAFANALEQAYHTTQQRLLSSEPDAPTLFPALDTSLISTRPKGGVMAKLGKQPTSNSLLTRRTLLTAGAGILALAAVGGGIWYANAPKYAVQGTTSYVYRHTDTVHSVAWHNDSIASGGDDETVQVWDAQSGIAITSFKHHNYVNGVAWSPDGKSIASCDNDQLVYVWTVATDGKASKDSLVYRGHTGSFLFNRVNTVAWSPDGRLIASSASDGTVQIWDPTSGHQEQIFKGHTNSFGPDVNTVAWSPDGHYLASAGTDGQILIWHADTLQIVQRYARPSTTFYDLSWSPDGKHLAIGSSDNTVIILNYPDDQQADPVTTIYTGHTDKVMSVSWSPDGRFIASGSVDNTVQIWQPVQTDQTIFIYKGHSKQINSVAWSNDSHRLASGSDDDTVRVWEAE